jgi:hypothetical protein
MEEISDFEFRNSDFWSGRREYANRLYRSALHAPCFSLSDLDVLAEKFNGGTAHLIRVVIGVAGDEQRAERR